MESIYLSDFYNHEKMKKDIADGEVIIAETDRQLRNTKKEESSVKVGDIIQTGETCNPVNKIGKVIDKWLDGPYLRFMVDWDYQTRKRKNKYITVVRLIDIKQKIGG